MNNLESVFKKFVQIKESVDKAGIALNIKKLSDELEGALSDFADALASQGPVESAELNKREALWWKAWEVAFNDGHYVMAAGYANECLDSFDKNFTPIPKTPTNENVL